MFIFGAKSFFSGVLIELNAQIDIFMLGIMVNDHYVGIYSFASVIAKGVCQLLVVFRINFNPISINFIATKQKQKFSDFFKKSRKNVYQIMTTFGIILILIYPLILKLLTNKKEFSQSWLPFSIILSGIIISSGYLPFNQLLLLAGHPGKHTLMVILTVLFNFLGNLVLIPFFGITGAAIATGLAFPFSIIILLFFLRNYTTINI